MKEIPLTKGRVVRVDDADYEEMSKKKWWYVKGYAMRRETRPDGTFYDFMHRRLTNAQKKEIVIHKDGDKLNNTRENLQIITSSLLRQWQEVRSCVNYKGVVKVKGRYRASVCVSGKTTHLGSFGSAIDAARAYDEAAIKYYGPLARLNLQDNAVVRCRLTQDVEVPNA